MPNSSAAGQPEGQKEAQAERQGAAWTLEAAVEALLFSAAEPLSLSEIADVLDVPRNRAKEVLAQIESSLASDKRGLTLKKVAGGYRILTKKCYEPLIRKLKSPRRRQLSPAALECLAIIAYRQPATRAEVDSIRGVQSSSPIQSLLEADLIKRSGRKETPGRPYLYRTTKHFLDAFGLADLSELPSLQELDKPH